jgi:hypothetical protein
MVSWTVCGTGEMGLGSLLMSKGAYFFLGRHLAAPQETHGQHEDPVY